MDSVAGNKPKKRKLEKQLGLAASPSSGKSAMSAQQAVLPSEAPRASAQRDDERDDIIEAVAITTPTILSVCRTALMHGPTATRAILARHRKSIDPDLTRVLETVGGYTNSVSLNRFIPQTFLQSRL